MYVFQSLVHLIKVLIKVLVLRLWYLESRYTCYVCIAGLIGKRDQQTASTAIITLPQMSGIHKCKENPLYARLPSRQDLLLHP